MRKMNRKLKKLTALAVTTVMVCSGLGTGAISAFASGNKYNLQYDSYDEVLEAGRDLNLEIAAEGFVLLKNQNKALPLQASENSVTVLGEFADSPAVGGGGSGSQKRPGTNHGSNVAADTASTIYDGLDKAGIKYNPRVKDKYLTANPEVYDGGSAGGVHAVTVEYENGKYMDAATEGETGAVKFAGKWYKNTSKGTLSGVETNYGRYDDAAIVYIARTGSEGSDCLPNHVPGHSDENEHYLELNDSEKELMAYAKANFKKVIVIINSPSVMEMGDIQDDEGIDSVLWVGQPGWNGLEAVGKILTGEINPSGRTVDFWMRDFESDPTWYNSNDYTQAQYLINGKYVKYGANAQEVNTIRMTGSALSNEAFTADDRAMDYTESIYMGYRYYETVYKDLGDKGEAWYNAHVAYPFGYGLSYTQFKQKITKVTGDLSDKDGKIKVEVAVTNTGLVAGKEVVQLYDTAPYTAGGIEKAAVDLVGFTKTDLIQPGKTQTVEIEIDVKDLAAFDYNDANENGKAGYELETGTYTLSIRNGSHEVLDTHELSASALLDWDEDGNQATPNNIFSQTGNAWEMYNTLAHNWTISGEDHYLTRDKLVVNGEVGDLTKLAWLLEEEEDGVFKEETALVMHNQRAEAAWEDNDNKLTATVETDYENVWVKTNADLGDWTQATDAQVAARENGKTAIQLYEMSGLDFDDAKWTTFMNQLSWAEMKGLVENARFQTLALEAIGKPATTDADGPGQLSDGWAWVCEVVVASTWNTELANKQGTIVGQESVVTGANGWYGPGLNIHRSPLNGRNFEYYSQDGVQAGLMAAAVVKGAVDQGAKVYIKHAFLNDQECGRRFTASFITEQTMRQIYAKPFELAIKKGNANAIMSSVVHIGIASSSSYATNIQLYENEWGFKGASVTDMYVNPSNGYWMEAQLLRSHNTPLGPVSGAFVHEGVWDSTLRDGKGGVKIKGSSTATAEDTESPTQYYYMRTLVQRMLYVCANSNAMKNGFSVDTVKASTNLTGTVRTAISGNLLTEASRTALKEVYGGDNYSVTATGLPEGVSVAADGTLFGTPVKSGTYNVTFSVNGKYGYSYINGTGYTATITVSAAAPRTDVQLGNGSTTELTLGTAYSASVALKEGIMTDANTAIGGDVVAANKDKYIKAPEYSATGLPEGLTMAKDGTISGTPAELGTFDIVVTATLTKVSERNVYGQISYNTATETKTGDVTLTVTGGYAVTVNAGNGLTADISVINGSSITVENLITAANAKINRGTGWTIIGLTDADGKEVTGSISQATTLTAVWKMPDVAIIDGIWWVNGENTGISAEGATGANGVDGKDGATIVAVAKVSSEGNVDTYVITMSDGSQHEFTITNGVNGTNGADGKDGENGKDGATGAQGEKGESGCGGSIASTAGIAVAALALVAAGVVISKKRRNADK